MNLLTRPLALQSVLAVFPVLVLQNARAALVLARLYAQAVLLQLIVPALQALIQALVQLVALLPLLPNDHQVENVLPILLRPVLQDVPLVEALTNVLALQALALPSVLLLLIMTILGLAESFKTMNQPKRNAL